jgi:hypothetical protein
VASSVMGWVGPTLRSVEGAASSAWPITKTTELACDLCEQVGRGGFCMTCPKYGVCPGQGQDTKFRFNLTSLIFIQAQAEENHRPEQCYKL